MKNKKEVDYKKEAKDYKMSLILLIIISFIYLITLIFMINLHFKSYEKANKICQELGYEGYVYTLKKVYYNDSDMYDIDLHGFCYKNNTLFKFNRSEEKIK